MAKRKQNAESTASLTACSDEAIAAEYARRLQLKRDMAREKLAARLKLVGEYYYTLLDFVPEHTGDCSDQKINPNGHPEPYCLRCALLDIRDAGGNNDNDLLIQLTGRYVDRDEYELPERL